MSELSQYDDGNVLTHAGGMANRKKRGRRPLDYPDDKNKVFSFFRMFLTFLYANFLFAVPIPYECWNPTFCQLSSQLSKSQHGRLYVRSIRVSYIVYHKTLWIRLHCKFGFYISTFFDLVTAFLSTACAPLSKLHTGLLTCRFRHSKIIILKIS